MELDCVAKLSKGKVLRESAAVLHFFLKIEPNFHALAQQQQQQQHRPSSEHNSSHKKPKLTCSQVAPT